MSGIDNNTLLYLRGDSFTDLSLNPIAIANNGVTITESDIVNNCYKVDGKNNYVSFSDVSLPSDFTIECMVNLGSYANGFGFPIITPVSSVVAGQQYISIITSSVNNYVAKRVAFSEHGNTSPRLQSSVEIDLNTWYHIALVRKNETIKLYVNGVNQGSLSYASVFSITNAGFGCIIDKEYGINTKIYNYRISNIARYTEDFTPSTKPYNSININVANYTSSKINFSITKLSNRETINKVEVLLNGKVSKTYIDTFRNLVYDIDILKCMLGENEITIRVTYDDIYTEEKILIHNVVADKLLVESNLEDINKRFKLLDNSVLNQKARLKDILIKKNIQDIENEDSLSNLIQKVKYLKGIPVIVCMDQDYLNANGNFLNHTKTIITGHNDTAGFSIVGRQNATGGSNNYMSGRLRCDFKLDFTNMSKITFYAKKVANHGVLSVRISDGLTNTFDNNMTYYAKLEVHYNNFPTTWTQYTINTSNITGVRTLSFIGGYVDNTGNTASQTQYSGIELHYAT